MNEQELLKKLREAFRQESRERLTDIGAALVALENVREGAQQQDLLESIYRDAHSLKGAARAVNLKEIEAVCQALESLFSGLKGATLTPSADLFDAIHKAIRFMEGMLVGDLNQPMAPVSKRDLAALIGELDACRGASTGGTVRAAVGSPPGTGLSRPAEPAPVAQTGLPSADLAARPAEQQASPGQTPGPATTAPPGPTSPPLATPTADTVTGSAPPPAPGRASAAPDLPPAPAFSAPVSPVPVSVPSIGPEVDDATVAVPARAAARTMAAPDSIRVAVDRLDQLLVKAEEMISLKLVSQQHLLHLRQTGQVFGLWRKKWAEAEPGWRALRQKMTANQTAHFQKEERAHWETTDKFLAWNQEQFQTLQRDLHTLTKAMDQANRAVGRLVDDLLETAKQVIMVESAILLDPLPRMVREIAREQGKEVSLLLSGGEVEVDRRILEEMRDPIIHLLRNALDHGMEKPEERLRVHKERQGTVQVHIAQTEGNKIEIRISDDGTGLDLAQIRDSALTKGLLSREQLLALDERGTIELIFHSGMSTAPIITNLSGRGLGMTIVREKVEKLGGTLMVDNRPGRGVTFRILLPVSLATFRGVIVQCGRHVFVIPSLHVEGLVRVTREEIRAVENCATILYKGDPIALVELAQVLGITGESPDQDQTTRILVAVLCVGQQRMGFRVHAVLKEQEVLVKGLGKQLQKVLHFAGATILGSGRIVPILNVQDLMASAVHAVGSVRPSEMGVQEEARRQSILVVEDSITSRMLLKNILEAAGYMVQTAVDGLDGLTTLKSSAVDLVISDVEMPRMNGFELTARIRSEPALARLPVVLVTSLSSREDRERGVEVGASAYIVKGDFDQNTLLGVIGRLV
ncbi:MAG: hybrid sensor histidine kinase/response regulator [Magnetococcus sp. DMHC-8]